MKDLKFLVRPNIQALHALPVTENQRETAEYRLDANESPFNSPYNRYSDHLQKEICKKAGLLRGIRPECIFPANGCNELIDMILRIFCTPQEDNAIGIVPSYPMFSRRAAVNNIEYRTVPLNSDYDFTAESVLDQTDTHTKIIFLCSPNTPTGNLLNRNEIIRTLESFEGIVVVDESYIDFSRTESLLKELPKHPNLIVLHSFSAAWSSAGIRLGLLYAIPEIVKYFHTIALPFHIGQPTCEHALDLIKRRFDIDRWVKHLLEERDKVIAAFKLLPICEKIYRTHANFFLVKVKNAESVHEYLLKNGIAVQNCDRMALCKDCLRISIGLPQENNALLGALRKFSEKKSGNRS